MDDAIRDLLAAGIAPADVAAALGLDLLAVTEAVAVAEAPAVVDEQPGPRPLALVMLAAETMQERLRRAAPRGRSL